MHPQFAPRTPLLGAALLLSVFAASCSPDVPGGGGAGLTPDSHTAFPIAAGTRHAYGSAALDGPIGCDSCHPPAADSFTTFTCGSCHEHPQAITDRLHLTVSGYAYADPGCLSCHPNGDPTAPPFDHGGIASDCASCHDAGRVFAALPVAGVTHVGTAGADCSGCHVTSSWQAAAAAPAGLVRDPSQDVALAALLPAYSGTSIARLTPEAEALPMSMDHASTQLPAGAMGTCANCHDLSGSYFPGRLHSSLEALGLGQPSRCTDCHADAAPTGFVGPTAAGRTPPSGEMKHDAVTWTNGAPGTSALVTSDCGVCHRSPPNLVGGTQPATWASAKSTGTAPALYHAALTAAAKAQPTSCLDCHANSRPALLTSATAALPANVTYDHGAAGTMGECRTCHAYVTLWSGGRYHLPGSATPATCLPCHDGERPASTAGWQSTAYAASPFDYATNAEGVTHGAGQDCAVCHKGPGTGGAWGATQSWTGGHFDHAGAQRCIRCHMTQRADLNPQPNALTPAAIAALLGFDHSINGTGDCLGCHEATVTANRYLDYGNPSSGNQVPGGDWAGGIAYPGSTLISSGTRFITVTELKLTRSGTPSLITGMTSTSATYYNQMLHDSAAVPPQVYAGPTSTPDYSKCWHCHTNTNGTVTSYSEGAFHVSLDNYSATPGGAVAPLPQPTSGCIDCHAQMRPSDVVEKTASELLPMDHSAGFTGQANIGGQSVTSVAQVDCGNCHANAGTAWADGAFHTKIGAAVPADCTLCHYPLMADAAASDATSTKYAFEHRSGQITFQSCQTCHTGALAKATTTPYASTLWKTGSYHPALSAQPALCLDCHASSDPAALTQSTVVYSLAQGGTATNGAQWMSHASATTSSKDCSACHAADAKKSGSAWSKSTAFHAVVTTLASCKECHGAGTTPGTGNNLPSGLTDAAMLTSAGGDPTTGVPAGTHDQLTHSDVNVTGHDCNFCHSQIGPSTVSGIAGKEWAQAQFHARFNPGGTLVMNGTTGRCSNCHMNVKPGATFVTFDHSTFTSTSGTQDCSACHTWPGTGTATAPNWLGAAAMPAYITVGGFTIPAPPATAPAIQNGINNLPHPAVATGTACTTCHTTAAGGKGAHGYDHLSTLIASNCDSCHETGSNLVGTVWNGATSASSGAGDTRPFTLTSVVATYSGNSKTITYPKHFFPVDCKECHKVPLGNGYVTTGSAYQTAWTFPHSKSKMANPSTCVMCHPNGIPN